MEEVAMNIFVVQHDPDMTTNSRPYKLSYHKTREGAEKFIDGHKSNDWEYWEIIQVPLKD
jgi:hypothetical protein